jgi:hypothetical protein
MENLIKNLKENDQDFEFYPTTDEIINKFYWSLPKNSFDLLEIGCGNGKIFKKLEELETKDERGCRKGAYLENKFAIEKSEILINQLPADICILGTDFWQQTLIDKEVDVIFSNPPYSEFEAWSAKIIKEGFCKEIYLVIPQRWIDSEEIQFAIKSRDAKFEILGDFDFLTADRAARAKVNLVKITFERKYGNFGACDPFDKFFEENFKIENGKKDWSQEQKEKKREKEEKDKHIESELVAGRDLVQVLVALYSRDMKKLMTNYQKLGEIDSELMKELNIDVRVVKEALKLKISGLKSLYWKEIFDRLDKIRKRLCSKQRQKLFERLNTSIDFTVDNVYAVLIWVIKNANQYLDQQITDIFQELTTADNTRNYKSNQTTWEQDKWRYREQKKSNYCLDYRLVVEGFWDNYNKELSGETINLINDLMTIAENLGFDGQSNLQFGWNKKPTTGEKVEFFMRPNWKSDNTSKRELFMECRFYKNGNTHIKLNKEFMKAFNIEAARINKWIRSPQEASEEFPDDCKVSESEAKKYFKGNFVLLSNPQQLLLN